MNEVSDTWVPVSGDTDLAAATARAVVLPDHDVVIWRTTSGAARAWENRCPHRGMRMSFGQVRSDQLVCRYHGWGFDEAGQCQSIPASPNATAPPAACMKTYGCQEASGLIWANVSVDPTGTPGPLVGDNEVVKSPLFCKSIFVDGDLASLLAIICNARFPVYGSEINTDEGSVEWQGRDLASGVVITASGAINEQIMIFGHQAIDQRCGLHVVIRSTGDIEQDALRRLHYGKWAKNLRWHLVNPNAATDGFPVFAGRKGDAG